MKLKWSKIIITSISIVVIILFMPIVHATPYVSINKTQPYDGYLIWFPIKVNDEKLWAILDTGAWMSVITDTDAHKLGLDKLRQSMNETGMIANGDNLTLKTVDVKISVDGSHPFKTLVAFSKTGGPNLLSLHDLLHMYHGITFKSCCLTGTSDSHKISWSRCPQ